MIGAKDLKPGLVVMYKGQLHEVVEAQFYKPCKGGSIMRMKFRNIKSGNVTPDTLRGDDTIEQVYLDQEDMQYLYKDDHGYCFMNQTTYEQIHVSEETLGDKSLYLKEGMVVTVKMHDHEVLGVEPPIHVVLQIAETEPGFRGNTVSGATKPAKMETGVIVKVPLFIEQGEYIKVDTRTGTYIERA
ncbi:MAG: elongation factor P [Candidatus Omnitrophica bacterium]|jgi:elongation factor P|nr:elongation factor P [Candidatus Omnitrophota bacterium]MDD4012667.1 elongation factor P [Candidatus Omnitrophota bacterium]